MRLQERAEYSVTSSNLDSLKQLREVVMNPSGKWAWIANRPTTKKDDDQEPHP